MNRRNFINKLSHTTAATLLINQTSPSIQKMSTQSDPKNSRFFTIDDFGAIANDKTVDSSKAIEEGLRFLSTQASGGTLLIPDGRYYCLSTITVPRGNKQRPLLLKSLSHAGILDFSLCADSLCLHADFSAKSGPPYVGFEHVSFLGNKEIDFALLKRCSQMEIHRCRFDKFKSVFAIHNSYAMRVINCDFQDIDHDVFKFLTNAHDFRCLNTHSYNTCIKKGAFFNFAGKKLTHNIRISGDYEKIGELIRCSEVGLAGLNMNDCYTEQAKRQLFNFTGKVFGFSFNNGSFSDGPNDSTTQVIDNVVSGTMYGNYVYKTQVQFGPQTEVLEVSGTHLRGKGGLSSSKNFTPTMNTSKFSKSSSHTPIKYYKDLMGRVNFEGQIILTSYENEIDLLTLPKNFTPKNTQLFPIYTSNGIAKITINNNGQVLLSELNKPNNNQELIVSLNSIFYLARN